MKTNVSIKFNSIKEYREIEKKLIEMGYELNKEKEYKFCLEYFKSKSYLYMNIISDKKCLVYYWNAGNIIRTYNSLQEFLND